MEPLTEDPPLLVAHQALLVRRAGRGDAHAYEVADHQGTPLGLVHRVDTERQSSPLRKVTNFLSWTSSLPTVRLDVTDLRGTALFSVEFSPEDAQFTAAVRDGAGTDIGLVAKAKGLRKIHFDLKASSCTLGTVEAEGWSGWDFSVHQGGAQIGRISQLGGRTFLGITATSDDYGLELDRSLNEPLRTLVVACAVGMDVSVSQGA